MSEPANNRDLLRASRSGDRAALDLLLQRHLPVLRAFVRLRMSPLLRARESSEDLVQSACLQLVRGLDDFDYRSEQAFRGWLYTAVLNKLRDHERDLRRDKRDARRDRALEPGSDERHLLKELYAGVLSPSQALMADEAVQQLEAAFDRLPEDYREVLTLSRIARMSRVAIAEQMNRSEASVRSLLTRARTELALQLEQAGSPER